MDRTTHVVIKEQCYCQVAVYSQFGCSTNCYRATTRQFTTCLFQSRGNAMTRETASVPTCTCDYRFHCLVASWVRFMMLICFCSRQWPVTRLDESYVLGVLGAECAIHHRARQLYNNISMLFLFPVKDGKLSTGVSATFNASCYG